VVGVGCRQSFASRTTPSENSTMLPTRPHEYSGAESAPESSLWAGCTCSEQPMCHCFQPTMCKLQWRHSGLLNHVNRMGDTVQVRVEGLWIGYTGGPVRGISCEAGAIALRHRVGQPHKFHEVQNACYSLGPFARRLLRRCHDAGLSDFHVCTPRRRVTMNNMAKLPFELSVPISRTRLKPHRGAGILEY
jgi:hypothetical protein